MTAYLGIGSNIEPEINITRGLRTLQSRNIKVESLSSHFLTKPLKHKSQAPYINGVWFVSGYPGDTPGLKAILQSVEKECGRVRTADPYSSRTLDLDILLTEDYASDEILSRDFIYIPLLEIGPNLILPGYGRLREHVDINRREQMVPLPEFTKELRRIIGE